MALTKVTGQVINNTTGLVVGVTTVGGGISATDGFFSGIVTAVGNASFSGNVSVGGTLTYEDVTNIDAVGLVTARNGIVVGSGITLSKDGDGFFTGVVTATSYAGDGSALTGIDATQIVTGNTSVQTVDTGSDGHVKVNTEGSERARIDSSGGVHIATTSGNEKLNVNGAVRVSGSSADFNAGLEGALVDYDTSNNIARFGHVNGASGSARPVSFVIGGSEKARIDSSGNLGIGENSPGAKVDAASGSDSAMGLRVSGGASGGTNIAQFRTNNGTSRLTVNNDVTVETGNLVIGTAGKGIDFSAQTATSITGTTVGSEVLDHYEEGTWTASLSAGETCTNNQSTYTRIGRLVVANCYISNFSDFNGNGSEFRINGLPFPAHNAQGGSYHGGGSITYAQSFNYGYPLLPLIGGNNNYIYFHRQDGTTNSWKYQDFHNTGNGSGGQLIVNMIYETDY